MLENRQPRGANELAAQQRILEIRRQEMLGRLVQDTVAVFMAGVQDLPSDERLDITYDRDGVPQVAREKREPGTADIIIREIHSYPMRVCARAGVSDGMLACMYAGNYPTLQSHRAGITPQFRAG